MTSSEGYKAAQLELIAHSLFCFVLFCFVLFCFVCLFVCLQEFMFAQSMDSSSVEEIQEFMEESIKGA